MVRLSRKLFAVAAPLMMLLALSVPTQVMAAGESQIRVFMYPCNEWNTGVESDKTCNPAPLGDVHVEGWNQYGEWKEQDFSEGASVHSFPGWWWAFERGVTVKIRTQEGWVSTTIQTSYPVHRGWVNFVFSPQYWNAQLIGYDRSYYFTDN